MAESQASLTSDKPPTRKLGLGLLIPETAAFDPTTTDQGVTIKPSDSSQNAPDAGDDSPPEGAEKGVVMEETGNTREEAELGVSIEKEFFQLTILQAEIEAASKRLEGVDAEEEGENLDEEKNGKGSESVQEKVGDEEGNVVKMVQSDHHDEEKNDNGAESIQGGNENKLKNDNDAESSEEENENEGRNEDEGKVGGQFGEEETKSAMHSYINNRRRVNYPMRPDAEDCAYYMKFGTCKFASCCKFNHPPRRKNQVDVYVKILHVIWFALIYEKIRLMYMLSLGFFSFTALLMIF